ncbi:MAG: hypothetical protein ACOC0P_08005 [Planctomycetota bacterium]
MTSTSLPIRRRGVVVDEDYVQVRSGQRQILHERSLDPSGATFHALRSSPA